MGGGNLRVFIMKSNEKVNYECPELVEFEMTPQELLCTSGEVIGEGSDPNIEL